MKSMSYPEPQLNLRTMRKECWDLAVIKRFLRAAKSLIYPQNPWCIKVCLLHHWQLPKDVWYFHFRCWRHIMISSKRSLGNEGLGCDLQGVIAGPCAAECRILLRHQQLGIKRSERSWALKVRTHLDENEMAGKSTDGDWATSVDKRSISYYPKE